MDDLRVRSRDENNRRVICVTRCRHGDRVLIDALVALRSNPITHSDDISLLGDVIMPDTKVIFSAIFIIMTFGSAR